MDTATITPVITAGGAARMLATRIEVDPRPLVVILQHCTGQPVLRIQVKEHNGRRQQGQYRLDAAKHRSELAALRAEPGTIVRWRASRLLTADDLVAADATLTWIPDRIPAEARALLDAGQRPAGHILGPLGAVRQARALAIGDEVESRAVLLLRGDPVVMAAERVTAVMCELMAGNHERCLPGCG